MSCTAYPHDVRVALERLVLPVAWGRVGRKPRGNRECKPGPLNVFIAGVGRELLPGCFPSYHTI
jgi:hypothetical protein